MGANLDTLVDKYEKRKIVHIQSGLQRSKGFSGTGRKPSSDDPPKDTGMNLPYALRGYGEE